MSLRRASLPSAPSQLPARRWQDLELPSRQASSIIRRDLEQTHLSKTGSRHGASLGSSERLIRIIRDYPTLTLPLTSSQTRKECSAEHDAGDECHHPLHEAPSPFPDPGVISAPVIFIKRDRLGAGTKEE